MKQKIFYILFFSLCSQGVNAVHSYSLLKQMAYQYQLKAEYSSAIKEYKRAVFLYPDSATEEVYERIGDLYFEMNDLANAALAYSHAVNISVHDSLKVEYVFKKAHCLQLENAFLLSIQELQSVKPQDSLQSKRLDFYLAISYYGAVDYRNAEKHFLACVYPDSLACAKIRSVFSNQKRFFRPNPKLAGKLSIIPGLGQFYSGDVYMGLNSVLLTGMLLGIGTYVGFRYSFIDAFLSVSPWFVRYYQGGLMKAGAIAQRVLEVNRSEIYNQILIIIDNSKTKKIL